MSASGNIETLPVALLRTNFSESRIKIQNFIEMNSIYNSSHNSISVLESDVSGDHVAKPHNKHVSHLSQPIASDTHQTFPESQTSALKLDLINITSCG